MGLGHLPSHNSSWLLRHEALGLPGQNRGILSLKGPVGAPWSQLFSLPVRMSVLVYWISEIKEFFQTVSMGLDIAHWTWSLKFFFFFPLKLNEKCSGRERCVGPSQPSVRNGLCSVVTRFSSTFLGHACPPGKGTGVGRPLFLGLTWAWLPLGLKDPIEDTRLCLPLSIFLEKTSGLSLPFVLQKRTWRTLTWPICLRTCCEA